jgi:hypothetical protein
LGKINAPTAAATSTMSPAAWLLRARGIAATVSPPIVVRSPPWRRLSFQAVWAEVKALCTAIGIPGSSFETRKVNADFTWLTLGAEVSFALKKR